jgi:hypothetical protein
MLDDADNIGRVCLEMLGFDCDRGRQSLRAAPLETNRDLLVSAEKASDGAPLDPTAGELAQLFASPVPAPITNANLTIDRRPSIAPLPGSAPVLFPSRRIYIPTRRTRSKLKGRIHSGFKQTSACWRPRRCAAARCNSLCGSPPRQSSMGGFRLAIYSTLMLGYWGGFWSLRQKSFAQNRAFVWVLAVSSWILPTGFGLWLFATGR